MKADSGRPQQGGVRLRAAAIWLHRYVGLLMAAFLLVAGLTGSLIAFYPQLDRLLNPELFVVTPPSPDAQMLDPFVLRDKLSEQLPPEHQPKDVILERAPETAVNYWVDEHEVFVDPYTGSILGERKFGDLREGRKNVLTFLYGLHFSLQLGEVGTVLFGVIALLWTVDCFVGAYLTFPRDKPGGSQRSWLARWLPAWKLKTGKLFSLVFSWHRASGLWVWGMLLVFAWSAVALNLREAVYEPVTHSLFGTPPDAFEALPHLDPPPPPQISLRDALAVGRRAMAQEAKQRGFDVLLERNLAYEGEHGLFTYMVESTLDIGPRLGETTIAFDETGKVHAFSAATGQHAGSTVTNWLIALHFGTVRAGGVVYRSFVCLMGVAVALLSITGVWIWWKKRPKKPAVAPKRA